MIIAIQPDDYTAFGKPAGTDASSPKWARYLRDAGHDVRWVNVYSPSILADLHGCCGFMWRWGHTRLMSRIAHRLLPIIEREMGLATYPDQHTCWHYDDKIAQSYLFSVHQIPSPRTWVCYSHDLAIDLSRTLRYPIVVKLAAGAGSINVDLVRTSAEAKRVIDRLFQHGVFRLWEAKHGQVSPGVRVCERGLESRKRDSLYASPFPLTEFHRGYIIFQEFVAGNSYDVRVVVIGDRAFGFRRFNRVADFRASGSGRIDWNSKRIDTRFVWLAFETAKRLKMQSCAIDGLMRDDEPVVSEVSYTYRSTTVRRCDGHWLLRRDAFPNSLKWQEGHMWPEKAQVEDFLLRLVH